MNLSPSLQAPAAPLPVARTRRTELFVLSSDDGLLLELGLVLCSLYFMARKTFFPVLGVIAALAGTVLGLWGFLL